MLDPQTSETEFRLLADNAPVMIWRSDGSRMCDWFNKPWLDFTGRTLEQEIGNGWADSVHPEDLGRLLAVYTASFERREPFSMEYRLRRHDGVYRWLLDNGRPFERHGAFAGYFGSCIDVTEQRDREDEMRRLAAEREALLREVHHRVNNNLQTLAAILQLRRRSADDASRVILGELAARVTAMSSVQRYLHIRDNMAAISVREFLVSVLSDITAGATAMPPGDFEVSLSEAANLGLAVAEVVGLVQEPGQDGDRGAGRAIEPKIRIAIDPEHRSILVEGRSPPRDVDFPLQLIRAYARAAGGSVEAFVQEAGTLRATLRLAGAPRRH
jgi:PAS domain S-box-containing protein